MRNKPLRGRMCSLFLMTGTMPEPAIPARLRSDIGIALANLPTPKEMNRGVGRGGTRMASEVLVGSDETRFINLGGLPQRIKASRCDACVLWVELHVNMTT